MENLNLNWDLGSVVAIVAVLIIGGCSLLMLLQWLFNQAKVKLYKNRNHGKF